MSPRVGGGGGGGRAEYEFDVSPGVYKCEFGVRPGWVGGGWGVGGGQNVSLVRVQASHVGQNVRLVQVQASQRGQHVSLVLVQASKGGQNVSLVLVQVYVSRVQNLGLI